MAVIVWVWSQLAFVNVSAEGETVTSPVSPLVTLTTTSEVGAAFKTAVNVAVVPVSLVFPETELIDIPGVEPLKSVTEKSSINKCAFWSSLRILIKTVLDKLFTL